MDSAPAPFHFTRTITLRPTHAVINELPYDVWVRGGDEKSTFGEPQIIPPGGNINPIHMRKPPNMRTPLSSMRFLQVGVSPGGVELLRATIGTSCDSTHVHWTNHFGIDKEQTFPINLGDSRTTDMLVTCGILKSSP